MIKNSFLFCLLLFFYSCTSSQNKKTIENDFNFNPLSKELKKNLSKEIEEKFYKIFGHKRFSGAVLVAKNGTVLFEKYVGMYDFKNKIPLNNTSSIHLASISKTFTAMVVLRLYEQGKIKLTDNIQKYFPKFPYNNITIDLLLSHRSGLPNYVYFFDKYRIETFYIKNKRGHKIRKTKRIKTNFDLKPGLLNNQDVLDFMVKYKPAIQYFPNQAFNYCNTNYILLALLIEKITKMSYPNYLKDSLFTPLGMKHSFVLNSSNIDLIKPSYNPNNTPYPIQKVDLVYGDKNIYSTVEDMFLWDIALYKNKIVSQNTLQFAHQGKSKIRNSFHNYGYGWRILESPNENIVYHNGWWHGNNTVFTRYLKDTFTIIVLGNKYNRQIYRSKELHNVLSGINESTNLLE